jgi:peptidoglycan/xylan/chitin deacetylase (PgdA/CDA1 family)
MSLLPIGLCGALLALLLTSMPAGAATAPAAVPVFAYHLVDRVLPADRIGNALTVTPAQLETELRYLQAHEIHTITASELAERLARGETLEHVAVLTFDDGYLDARTEALPLLQRYGAKATFYVIAHTIGTPRHLAWRDIRALLAAGMEIGAHGTDHLDLSKMPPAEQQFQVTHCIETIARYTGVRPRTYAYPSGRYDAATLAVMKAEGIEAAFTMQYGLVHSLGRPYELPRVRIERTTAEVTYESALAAAR